MPVIGDKLFKPVFHITESILNSVKESELLNANYSSNNEIVIESFDYLEIRKKLFSKKDTSITPLLIQEINAGVVGGTVPSNFQIDGGYVINNRQIVYSSPGMSEVYINNLISWIDRESADIPIPIFAAITYSELLKIHPFLVGNKRTARLLTTHLLYQHGKPNGFTLPSCFAFEEYIVKNKEMNCKQLFGESNEIQFYDPAKDISSWIEYFCTSLVAALQSQINKDE